MKKRLYRSSEDHVITGLCGGVAEYNDWDPSMVRLAAIGLICFTGFIPGVVAYFVSSVVVPLKQEK